MKKIMLLLGFIIALLIVSPNYSFAQTTTVETKTNKSHKGKSAAIGAGAGAVTGAIVSKKKGKGALIGGAVGAGAGYLYGRHRDKKHPKTVTKTKVVTQ
jgi:outer membrane lipoprotein SlyB